MKRGRNTIGRVVAYHGCDLKIAKKLLNHDIDIASSTNQYDWLGDGAYFWIDTPKRAIDWAIWKKERGHITTPAVIGAFIYPGLCLNLCDYGVMDSVRDAYARLKLLFDATGTPLPVNKTERDGVSMERFLDCAVFNMLHNIRAANGDDPYDSVVGIFEEGPFVFPGASFRDKTHIQIAIINPECIIGYFQVRGYEIFR